MKTKRFILGASIVLAVVFTFACAGNKKAAPDIESTKNLESDVDQVLGVE